jgi:hypothetical protein
MFDIPVVIYRAYTKEWCGVVVICVLTAPCFCVCPVYRFCLLDIDEFHVVFNVHLEINFQCIRWLKKKLKKINVKTYGEHNVKKFIKSRLHQALISASNAVIKIMFQFRHSPHWSLSVGNVYISKIFQKHLINLS